MSRFIAEALREKIRRERTREIDADLIEGYKSTASEDKKLNEEWEPATVGDNGWQQVIPRGPEMECIARSG